MIYKVAIKLLYLPFALVAGRVGAVAGKRLFAAAWGRIDDAPPPHPSTRDVPFAKILVAETLRWVTSTTARTASDRASAHTFHYLIGAWPGQKSASSD